MVVLKIGGSLLGSPELMHWLDIVANFGDGKVMIVPGGGLFADAVREAQQLSNTSDAIAHKLSVLAMDQFGLLLADMQPALATASNASEIIEYSGQHRGMVWLPSQMVLADDSIPKNWQVTSDSLSAWLACKIGAEQLILVKSKPLAAYLKSTSIPLQKLVEDDLIDCQFSHFSSGKHSQTGVLNTWVLNKRDFSSFERGFDLDKLKQHGLLVDHGVSTIYMDHNI
jgi:aspartokinase-like uncharacterized kinase